MTSMSSLNLSNAPAVCRRSLPPAKLRLPEFSTVYGWLNCSNKHEPLGYQIRRKQISKVTECRVASLEASQVSEKVGPAVRTPEEANKKIEESIAYVKELLMTSGDGRISVAPYDTSIVALIKDKEGRDAPEFPSCLEWIAENQMSDGSWGDEFFCIYDRVVNTLACVVALKSWNVHADKIEKGNIISMILFLSPLPTFYRIWRRKSVEQYSPLPYLATFGNCMLWVLYGLPMVHPHSILVVTINGAGVAIQAVYLSLFLIFSDQKKRLRVAVAVAAECILVAVLALMVLTLAHTTKLRSSIVGSIAMVGNVMMYASPLSVMKLVITTRSVEYMPFFLSLFSLLNGACWASYALIRFDPFIAAPNGMGTLFGVAQIILYATFYRSTKVMKAQPQPQPQQELALSQKPHTNV